MSISNYKPTLYISSDKISKAVKIWLFIGLVMIFFQVILGGITRLTGSGLSITKWDIIVGSIPPLNQIQWEDAFDLYKETPQYQKINKGMSLSEFKFIYFWEFTHRLWGRLMGLVFIFPFLFFWRKGMFSKTLLKDLFIVLILASIVASFGWIMVASGLINRPWVNAYKLTLHLSLAVLCFSYLLWTIFKVVQPVKKVIHNSLLKRLGITLIIVISIQIMLGGIMAGLKAGSYYPTWPDMNGEFIPNIVFDRSAWHVENFVNYERSSFLPTLIQVLHRIVSYLLVINVLCYFLYAFSMNIKGLFRVGLFLLITMLAIQFLLGVFTVINCAGSTPLGLGVMHQAGAILLLSIALFLNFQMTGKERNNC